MASWTQIIASIAVGATLVAIGIGEYHNRTKPKSNLETEVTADEPKQYIIDKGMDLPAELHLNRNAAVIGNQVYSEVTAAYRDELNKRGMKELGDKQRYQIYGKCIDDTIENPTDVGEPTVDESRNAWLMIKEIKKTSKNREEYLENIRKAFPLDFEGAIVEEKTSGESAEEKFGKRLYGPIQRSYGPRRSGPSGQLSDKATWQHMFPR